MEESVIVAVRSYLEEQFPAGTVRTEDPGDERGYTFVVSNGGVEHRLRLSPDLATLEASALDAWDVAGELRRQEDQPMQLTPAGLRLESAN